jgi:hypothetical protein
MKHRLLVGSRAPQITVDEPNAGESARPDRLWRKTERLTRREREVAFASGLRSHQQGHR